jgi:hypothetical protein
VKSAERAGSPAAMGGPDGRHFDELPRLFLLAVVSPCPCHRLSARTLTRGKTEDGRRKRQVTRGEGLSRSPSLPSGRDRSLAPAGCDRRRDDFTRSGTAVRCVTAVYGRKTWAASKSPTMGDSQPNKELLLFRHWGSAPTPGWAVASDRNGISGRGSVEWRRVNVDGGAWARAIATGPRDGVRCLRTGRGPSR